MDTAFDDARSSTIVKNPKIHKRKKIRRLIDSTDLVRNKNESAYKLKRILITTTLIIFAIALFVGHYFTQNNSNTKKILNEFLKNYRNQYIEIVHGKSNYCDQTQRLDTATLFASIKENHILHQEKALHQIEVALRNKSDINVIALVGPVGVGKTLFIRALQKNFPWQENVHNYAWNTYVNDEAKKFHLIRVIIENLSECGQNLLVIDNLQTCDQEAVPIINKLLVEANNRQRKRVVLFYVFNLNTMLSAKAYALQKDMLQSIPDCKVINFKSFTRNQVRECIQREAEIENMALTEEDYNDIVATIDPFESGCKNVNAKVLMYGTIKTNLDIY